MLPTYFTCTLGQARRQQESQRYTPYQTVTGLVDHKAKHSPGLPAVGFYHVPVQTNSRQWQGKILSFADVQQLSAGVAETIRTKIKLHARRGQTVALLSPSSESFLFTWLALMRLGHPVLLIAPQCSASAIANLLDVCNAVDLFYDQTNLELAKKVKREVEHHDTLSTMINVVAIPAIKKGEGPEISELTGDSVDTVHEHQDQDQIVCDTDIAYLHHTSGTSTGVPKPIPQSHRAAVGVLPCFDGHTAATFTTTPLYHGGIADVFRAWTSNALIWLFPGKELPITAAHVFTCLDIAQNQAKLDPAIPPVKYFSSVPYVLQMLANDNKGLDILQSMDIVGVGGAALPIDVGNSLVQKNVNLISRFGSAECGFLMSSHRDYCQDKEWQYLRSSPGGDQLQFEPREGGLFELVIQPDWPHMAKRNRGNRSYATADLFTPHSSIPNAWRYHSRSDSQLTLITGKKFDPGPLEDAIKASSDSLDGVLIFGNGKSYPGALLFRSESARMISNSELIRELWPKIATLNHETQRHARISRNMLVPMMPVVEGLAKSSKGTILRKIVEQEYAGIIEATYANLQLPNCSTNIPDSEVSDALREIILSVAGGDHLEDDHLSDETDLFTFGVDSVGCIQIRNAVARMIPNSSFASLPLTLVEDAGTISHLRDTILRLRSGESVQNDSNDQHQLMLDLVQKYRVSQVAEETHNRGSEEQRSRIPNNHGGIHVLLTGATGSLGSHILDQLLSDPQVSHISLLVRNNSEHAPRERVFEALTSRKLNIPSNLDTKTTILSCRLSDQDLGLSKHEYHVLADSVDVIMHLAWSVNFLISLKSIAGTHLAGLQNILNFALRSPRSPRVIFCSSVASVSNYQPPQSVSWGTTGRFIPEAYVADPSASGPTGYARSKWIAEAICADADNSTKLKHRVSVCRVGQLSGATKTGIWNMSEAYPLLMVSAKATGVLPDLNNEILNWLPVDLAAKAFVELAVERCVIDRTSDTLAVYHVLNPDMGVHWSDLLVWLSKELSFKVVTVDEWLKTLEQLKESPATRDHPALKLLGFWQRGYGGRKRSSIEDRPIQSYQMSTTHQHMPTLRVAETSYLVNESQIRKLWQWIQHSDSPT
ncbi:hypothetical protein PV10_06802 [Exophiala mesophila]|uniref:Carrier domain-containing protein n=1 Tax=Exophiala mesophila TaxID=212818 RepID=A0A0D1WT31_EXOME|nr:uncharacterized protein PV10_06802 [Exophiala mesophila]KIV92355.1 hypothetical protein PV10_06802 [Exophiala mesophila]